MGKRPTLADVAERAGLSLAATSMILNNRPGTRLSADAQTRVRSAAAELGYRPNVNARGLRTAKTKTIGFISDAVAVTRYASGLIRGALAAAEAADHVLLVLETGGDHRREERALEAVLDRQVDGIIFATVRSREISVPHLPSGMRSVVLNATNSSIPLSVRPDELAGGRIAASAIVRAGHRDGIVLLGLHPGLVTEGDPLYSLNVARRMTGIRDVLASSDRAFEAELDVAEWSPDGGYQAMAGYLRDGGHLRCVLALNDALAFGAYQALAEFGRAVPGDVSVVSFDNDELAAYLRPGLTTVALPYEQMGAAAVDLMLSDRDSAELLIPMHLLQRESLALHDGQDRSRT